MKIYLSWQDQHFRWQHYGCFHNAISAYTTAHSRANSTGKRYRLKSDDGTLLDYVEPS